MIDTPGHVDFSYEVSRSLAACEGALLVVDAAQGVEAQSVANCYTAHRAGARGRAGASTRSTCRRPTRDSVIKEIEEIIGIEAEDALARQRQDRRGRAELLETLIERIPPPQGRSGRAAAGADHRLLVRQLRRRRLAGARRQRLAQDRREDPRDVDRPRAPGRQARPLHAEVGGRARRSRPARSAS